MKKLFSCLAMLVVLLACSSAFASVGIRVNGVMVGTATDLNIGCGTGTNAVVSSDGSIYNILCSPNLINAGLANGGATSLATIDSGVPTSFAYVRKAIDAKGTRNDVLPNGIPGQMLTIAITTVANAGTWILTPTTATDFSSITFNGALQRATFVYLSDTLGWIVQSADGSGAAAAPTVTPGN